MATVHYPASSSAGGGRGIVFPDLPGYTSAGATVDEAALNAAAARVALAEQC